MEREPRRETPVRCPPFPVRRPREPRSAEDGAQAESGEGGNGSVWVFWGAEAAKMEEETGAGGASVVEWEPKPREPQRALAFGIRGEAWPRASDLWALAWPCAGDAWPVCPSLMGSSSGKVDNGSGPAWKVSGPARPIRASITRPTRACAWSPHS